jgi:hypothetical protein
MLGAFALLVGVLPFDALNRRLPAIRARMAQVQQAHIVVIDESAGTADAGTVQRTIDLDRATLRAYTVTTITSTRGTRSTESLSLGADQYTRAAGAGAWDRGAADPQALARPVDWVASACSRSRTRLAGIARSAASW